MVSCSSVSDLPEEEPLMESAPHAVPKGEAEATSEGGRFFTFDFSSEDRSRMRKLLLAVLTEDPKDSSPMTRVTSQEFEASDLSETSDTSTNCSDLSDDEDLDNDFFFDDVE